MPLLAAPRPVHKYLDNLLRVYRFPDQVQKYTAYPVFYKLSKSSSLSHQELPIQQVDQPGALVITIAYRYPNTTYIPRARRGISSPSPILSLIRAMCTLTEYQHPCDNSSWAWNYCQYASAPRPCAELRTYSYQILWACPWRWCVRCREAGPPF